MKFQRFAFCAVCFCCAASLVGCAYSVEDHSLDEIDYEDVEPASPQTNPPEVDGPHAAQTEDLCPDDPAKLEPGLCGCGRSDDDYQPVDTDGDGVVDCADACPFNAHKIEPLQSGCDVPDSDGDGYDDGVDACPTNPNIHAPGSVDQPYAENCLVDTDHTFHVYAPQDLKYLPHTKGVQKIRLEADINLNARNRSLGELPPVCDLSLSSTLSFEPVTLEGNYHTLTNTTVSGERCALDNALFKTLNGASNLTLDLDYKGQMAAALAENGTGAFENIRYQGNFAFVGSYKSIGGLFHSLSDCKLQNTTTQNAHFNIQGGHFGALAYSLERCAIEMPVPMHIAELIAPTDDTTRVYGVAAQADALSNIHLVIDTMSGYGAGIADTCQSLAQSTVKIGRSDHAPALLDRVVGDDGSWSVQNVSVSIGELRNAPVLINNVFASESASGTIADVTLDVTGRVTYDAQNSSGGLLGSVMLSSSQCQEQPLLSIERLESRIPVVELNASGMFGGIAAYLSVSQPNTAYQLEYCQKNTPVPALVLDQINSYVSRIQHNSATHVGGLFGGIENVSSDNDLVPACYLHKRMPSILLKNVLSFVNIYTTQNLIKYTAQIAALVTEHAEQNLMYTSNGVVDMWSPDANWPLPIWPVWSAQAIVLAGDIQIASNNTHASERLIGSLETEAVQNYTSFTYEDAFTYHYNRSAAQLPTGMIGVSADQTDGMTAYLSTLQFYSDAWQLTQTRINNAFVQMPYLKLTENSGF